MDRGDLLLSVYRLGVRAVSPLGPAFLKWRLSRGKEHETRWPERLGRAAHQRPGGRLVWLHGASVGESVALLPLIGALAARGDAVLATSGTTTSAKVLATRLPAGAMHQFAPLDLPSAVERFLDHWRPNALMIAESELWPNLLVEAKRRGIPVFIVNARMSPRSFERWRKAPSVIGALLRRVDLVLARTPEDGERYSALGAPAALVAGNLKYDVPPPPADPAHLASLSARIGARPVWAAASTHDGEEEAAIAAHRALETRFPDLLTIIAPRHPERGEAIAELARAQGLAVGRRSRGEPVEGAEIYLFDTIGELGLVYRLAGLAFVGGTLTDRGGQNPIEPAKLGAAVLHGPSTQNFSEDYTLLDDARGGLEVADATALAVAVGRLLGEPAKLRAMGRAANEAVERQGGATHRILRALAHFEAAGGGA
jgi:3-deoxy-D-manno-octulosonic-acid transferase